MDIYYINLDGRPERRKFMEEQFQALGLIASRLPAVTPESIAKPLWDRHCNPRKGGYLYPVELACSLSHEAVWQNIARDMTERYSLVLEDDVMLSPALPAFLDAIEATGVSRPAIRLETTMHRCRMMPRIAEFNGIEIRPYLSFGTGSGAYLITPSLARRLLANEAARWRHVDALLWDDFNGWVQEHERALACPALGIQLSVHEQVNGRVTPAGVSTIKSPAPLYDLTHPRRAKALRIMRNLMGVAKHLRFAPFGLDRETVRLA